MNLRGELCVENAAAFASARVRTSITSRPGGPNGFDTARNQCARRPMPGRLRQATVQLAHATHLACQPQLTDDNQAVRQGPVEIVADDGQSKTAIAGRLRA